MNEIMIDFETLGTDPDTVVLSLGACFFDVTSEKIGDTFSINFDITTQLSKGRNISMSTLRWWMQQSNAAKSIFNEESEDTEVALIAFHEWVSVCADPTVWGNGSSFDVSIIEGLFRSYNLSIPWKYYNVYDLRTFKRFVAKGAKIQTIGTKHNALDDAMTQAAYIIRYLKERE